MKRFIFNYFCPAIIATVTYLALGYLSCRVYGYIDPLELLFYLSCIVVIVYEFNIPKWVIIVLCGFIGYMGCVITNSPELKCTLRSLGINTEFVAKYFLIAFSGTTITGLYRIIKKKFFSDPTC